VTTIHGFVSTLNRLEARLSPEQRAELREALEGQTERMATLVDQLLDLSRLDADVIRIRPETFLLRDRLEDITAVAAGERAGSVVLEVPPDLVGIADLDAFDRIVSNLITNALRYGAPPVYVTAQQTDRHLRLWVEDRGDGVAPEFVPSLFDRFARSRESRERVAEGTGLGLAIAQSYARAHKGDLLYEPAEPRGARFQLVLPTRVEGNGNGG
jgi:signal transduction histidine kinase